MLSTLIDLHHALQRRFADVGALLRRLPSHQPTRSRGVNASQLEDRIFMSAVPVAAEPTPDSGADQALATAPDQFAFADDHAVTAADGADTGGDDPTASDQQAAETLRRELVFVDTGASDYQQLVDDLLAVSDADRELEVYLLDGNRDGVQQISEILAGYDDVDAVHLVSHGTDGKVNLGNVWLDIDNLSGYAGEIAGWNDALRDGGDLLIYGCDVAKSSAGQDLTEALGRLTGADVAASTDHTGYAPRGGDWQLEYEYGTIETALAFSIHVQQDWTGLLTAVTVTTTADAVDALDLSSVAALIGDPGLDGVISLREAILAANAMSDADDIFLGTGTYTLSIEGSSEQLAATGDLDIWENVTIHGADPTSTIIDAGGMTVDTDRVFDVLGGGLTLIDVQVAGGNYNGGGGAAIAFGAQLTTLDVEFFNNTSNNGGAIQNDGTLVADRTRFINNTANNGGAIDNNGTMGLTDVQLAGNLVSNAGGGIRNSGTGVLVGVTISGNTATFAGGLHNAATADLDLLNVTISGNTANSGGGIYNNGTVDTTNATFAFNSGGSQGGGIMNDGGTVNLTNTILYANMAVLGADYSGTVISTGDNLIGDISDSSGFGGGDLFGVDPLLDPVLNDNGGFAPTHALLVGSPAVNAGSDSVGHTTDQRGFPHIGAPDIGAYELLPNGITVTTTDDVVDAVDLSSVAALISDPGPDGVISLREAILAANANSDVDDIFLAAGTYALTIEGSAEELAATGDLDVWEDVNIHGAGASLTTIDAGGMIVDTDRAFDVLSGTLTLSDLAVANGVANATGGGGARIGGTAQLTVVDTIFEGNSATNGGAIANFGDLVADTSVFTGNDANGGGAIDNNGTMTLTDVEIDGNSATSGGGIRNSRSATLSNVTISNNYADGSGGGIYNNTGIVGMDLINVTISGNTADNRGGGIYTGDLISATNVTIAFNTVTTAITGSGGGIYAQGASADVLLASSIVSNNTAALGRNSNVGLASLGNNVVDEAATLASIEAGDQPNTDPLLDPLLQNNGGFTRTHALQLGSVAIDPLVDLGSPTTDQRGYLRIGTPDSGAFEMGATRTTTTDSLWLTTQLDVGTSGAPGLGSWTAGEVLEFGDPNLKFEPEGSTDGTLGSLLNLDGFNPIADGGDLNVELSAIHYVSRDILVGGVTTFQLEAGDLLLSTDQAEFLRSANTLTVGADDVFVFRPGASGDYSSGEFFMLLEDLGSSARSVRGITLVEADSVVGDTRLSTGTFLFNQAHDTGVRSQKDIFGWDPDTVGSGPTTGTEQLLIDGNDVGFGASIGGIGFVEATTTIAGTTLTAGSILVSVAGPSTVGDNGEPVDEYDVFALDVAKTTLVAGLGNTSAEATLVFDGGDVALNTADEMVSGFTLFGTPDSVLMAAVDDVASTLEVTPVNIDVLANDTGSSIEVFDYTLAANGSVVDNGDGTFTYTPDPAFTGTDAFNYVISDGSDGTTHYWRLDGDVVDSIGSNHGTLTGTTTVEGYFGEGLAFDEIDDHVVIPDFSYGNTFTVAFRFKVDDISGSDFQYIYSHGQIDTPDSLNIYIGETGSSYAGILLTNLQDVNDSTNGTALNVDISGLIGDGNWHTYTLSVNSGAGARVFIDGSLASTAARGDDSLDPGTDLYLGAREDEDGNRFYGGALDSVQIVDRALSTGEVADLAAFTAQRATVSITVDPANSAPTALNLTQLRTYTEGDASVALDDIIVSDVDSGDTITARLTLANTATGTLTTGTFGAVTSTYNAVTGVWEAIGNVTDVNAALADVAFTPATHNALDTTITTHIDDQAAAGPADGTITLDATPVNDEPSFSTLGNQTVDEDSGPHTVAGFATALPGGGADESGQTFTYAVSNDNGALFAVAPAIDASGQLTYTLAADKYGTATVTVSVTDSGGTAMGGDDTSPDQTFDIVVSPVNDEPAGADKTVATPEDIDYVFTVADFGLSDPIDVPADSLFAVRITSLPLAGTLTESGNPVTAGQFISASDISGGKLKFTPDPETSGTGYASFTFQVQDDGGTAGGGIDLDQSPNTITVDVTAVNDAPTLDNSQNLTLDTIQKDESPATNDGNSVLEILNSDAGNPISDPDGALTGIAINKIGDSDGTWEYSTDGGSVWNPIDPDGLGAITIDNTNAILLEADAGGQNRIRFNPDPGYTGSAGDIEFRAWDGTESPALGSGNYVDIDAAGMGDDTPFSTQVEKATLWVNAPPTISLINNQPIMINTTTGLVGFSVGDDEDSNSLLVVTTTSSNTTLVPPAGISLTGTGGSRDVEVTPTAGETGTATITLTVTDTEGAQTQTDFYVFVAPHVVTVTTETDIDDAPDLSSIAALLDDPGLDNEISLREAVIAANNTMNGSGPDQIILPSGTYTLNQGSGDDNANSGDLDLRDDVLITGDGARTTIVDGNNLDRIFETRDGSEATITGITIANGNSTNGAIYVNGTTVLNLTDATVRDSSGGAAHIHGTLNLERVTLTGNMADNGGGLYFHGADGGSLTNVTISGNTATGEGGGIWTDTVISVTHSTIADNLALSGGGIFLDSGGDVLLSNSILRHHTLSTNSNLALTSGDFNIDSDGTALLAGPNDLVADPQIFGLADNDGPTDTHALKLASPAVDPAGLTGAPTVDQRGVARDATPDIGAYEGFIPNIDPTFSSFTGPVDTTNEDTEVEITLAKLKTRGDENDTDGTIDAFVVKSVTSGTLKIGSTAATATPWDASTNNAIDASHHAYWTPDPDTVGTQNAFEVAARDDQRAETTGRAIAQIMVDPVNDEPSFTTLGSRTVNEDSGPHTVVGFASALPGGGPDESGQTFSYTVTNDNGALFAVGPAIDAAGTLTYTLAADAVGTATVTARVTDSGGTALGGDDTSPDQTFAINVNLVNDEPSFTTLGDQTVDEDSGSHTVAGFASALPGGGPDESGQTFSYTVTNDNGALFAVGPAIDAAGTLTYTLAADAVGTATVTARVTDSGGTALGGDDTSPDQTFAINGNPVNDSTPVADTESFTVLEGGTATEADLAVGTSLLDGDTDFDLPNDTLTVSTIPVSGPSFASSFTLNADGTFSYTHDGSENFTDSFTYEVSDAVGNTDSATVTITITPVNDNTPVADTETFTVLEGGTATEADLIVGTSLLDGDTDVDLPNDTLTVSTTPVSGPSFASSFTLNADGTFSYTHDGSENFTDSFTYEVSDALGNTDTATVTITITPVNDNTPVADTESFTVAEGGTATEADLIVGTSLLDGDTDIDLPNDTLTVSTTPVSGPSFASSFTLNADGTFSYTHDGSENFTDSFTYEVSDAVGNTDSATVTITITITPGNDNTPVADTESFTVAEGGTATEADLDVGASLLDGDTDVDLPNDTLTVSTTPVSGPSFASSFTLNADGTFSYTHDGSENFTDSFTYEVSDAVGNTDTATVTITITPVNDNTPVADTESFTVAEGGTATEADLDVGTSLLDGDTDIDLPNDTLTVSTTPVSGPSFASSFTLNADGTFSYTHDGSENFTDSFTYEVSDAVGNTDTATVTITITPANDNAPLAVAESYTVDADSTLTVPADGVLTNDGDVDGDPLSTILVSGPASGSLTLNPDGSFTYTPDIAFAGTVIFSYVANDGMVDSNVATVNITVNAIAVSPTVTPPSTDPPPDDDSSSNDDSPPVSEPPPVDGGTEDSPPPTPASPTSARVENTGSNVVLLKDEPSTTLDLGQAFIDLGFADATGYGAQLPAKAALQAVDPERIVAAVGNFSFIAGPGAFWNDLDELKDAVEGFDDVPQIVAGSAATFSSVITAGYVMWTIRGGYLISSLLAQMPAWQMVNPLVILDYMDDEEDDLAAPGESAEKQAERKVDKMFDDQSAKKKIKKRFVSR